MTINDAKKVMLDKVNLEIEVAELRDEIKAKERQIKRLRNEVDEMQMQYDDLANSKVRQFFLGLTGKKEARLQEAQNEVRRTNGELSSAEFELESLKKRVEDIEQTQAEIESVCNECMKVIEEMDGSDVKMKLISIGAVPRIRMEITEGLAEVKPLFTTAYDIYAIRTGVPTTPGTYINKDSEMRKLSREIEQGVNHIIEMLNSYNLYVPKEIKIEFHAKWMEKENYWEEQQMAYDTMERIKTVEEWFCRVENCWKVMQKQQKKEMQKVQEEVLAYLDD